MTHTSSVRDRVWRLPPGGIRVIVTVADELDRLGLEHMLHLLGPAVRVRCEPSLPTALALAGDDPATVLVVPFSDVRGAAEQAIHRSVASGVRVLLLLGGDDPVTPAALGRTPGCGFLDAAELDDEALADALERAWRGKPVIPPTLAARLLAAIGDPPPVAPRVRVTPREQQALHLLTEGLSNRQIGRRLMISEHGAKRLVANLMAKLDCPSRTMVVAKAMRVGMLDGDAGRPGVSQ